MFIVEDKNTHNKNNFQEYFEKYKDIYIKKRIADKNVWNINKTRFYMSYGRMHWIITLDLNKSIFLTNLNN